MEFADHLGHHVRRNCLLAAVLVVLFEAGIHDAAGYRETAVAAECPLLAEHGETVLKMWIQGQAAMKTVVVDQGGAVG
jgi:hypothetical protein